MPPLTKSKPPKGGRPAAIAQRTVATPVTAPPAVAPTPPNYVIANVDPASHSKAFLLEKEAVALIKRLDATSKQQPQPQSPPQQQQDSAVDSPLLASPASTVLPLTEDESLRLITICHRLLEHHPYHAKRIGAVAVLWTGYQVRLKDTEMAAFATLGRLRGPSAATVACFRPEWLAVKQSLDEAVHKANAKFHSLLENLRQFAHTSDGRRLLLRCYLCLGDISRYRDRVLVAAYARAADLQQTDPTAVEGMGLVPRSDWRRIGELEDARQFYESARTIVPQHGQAYNQLALIYDSSGRSDALQAAYFYVRAVTAPEKPFKAASESLRRLAKRLADRGATFPSTTLPTHHGSYADLEAHIVAAWGGDVDGVASTPSDSSVAAFVNAFGVHAVSGQVSPQERLFTKVGIGSALAQNGAVTELVTTVALHAVLRMATLSDALKNTDLAAGLTFLLLAARRPLRLDDENLARSLDRLRDVAQSLLAEYEPKLAVALGDDSVAANELVYFAVVGRVDSGGRQLGLPPEDVELDGVDPAVMNTVQQRLLAALSFRFPANKGFDASAPPTSSEGETRRRKTPMVIDGTQLLVHRMRRLSAVVDAVISGLWTSAAPPRPVEDVKPLQAAKAQVQPSPAVPSPPPARPQPSADEDEGDEITPQQALARLLWGD